MRAASALAAVLLVAASAPNSLQQRLTVAEAGALPIVAAGAGTSGLQTIETRLLQGNPSRPGLYSISIKVPPNTKIAAHTHSDDRTAVVIAGVWHFGYGSVASGANTRALGPGSFYTEPGDDPHFARTGPEGATIYITGVGPSDTRYLTVSK